MSNDLIIPDAARIMFGTSWREELQQKQSRLRPLFANVHTGCTGNSITVDILAKSDGEDVTGQRFKNVEINEVNNGIRYIYPIEYQHPTHISKWDPNTIAPLVNPAGSQTKIHSMAYGRFCDRHYLQQILGNASEGASGGGQPTTVALPASQKIAKDFVSSGSATESSLTVDKLIEAVRILSEAEAWNDDLQAMGVKLCIATNAKTNAALLRSVESGLGAKLMSRDYMPPTLDDQGRIASFLGIHFVRTEFVSTVTDGDDKVALLPLWASNAVDIAFWEDSTTTIDRLPSKSNALQFLTQARIGCARIYDEGVIQLACRTGAA